MRIILALFISMQAFTAHAGELEDRIEEVRIKMVHMFAGIHKIRVAKWMYIGVDTHRMPEDLREPFKEKLLVCDGKEQCEAAEKAWAKHYLED